MPTTRSLAVAVLVMLGLGLLSPCVAHSAPSEGPVVAAVAPLRCLDDALAGYAESGRGWTGGDSTWSVPLPDGREVFAFSDTFLGPVAAHMRAPNAAFVHNSFVVRNIDGRWSTITGGTPEHPASLISPADPEHWYWLGAPTYSDGALQVPLTEWAPTGAGPFDFAFVGSALARFDPADLSIPEVTPLPSSRGIQWGQWVQPNGDWTYVYGVEAVGDTKYLHVARMPGGDLRQPFSFWAGWGWSPFEEHSIPVADAVYAELSVHRIRDDLYMLTTMEGGAGFSGRLVGRFGAGPVGPFGPPVTLYLTPETGGFGRYHDPDVYTYNAHVHPEFSTPTQLVISYNVNSLDTAPGGDVYRDVSIYRPRFVAVTLNWPGDPAPAVQPAVPACPGVAAAPVRR